MRAIHIALAVVSFIVFSSPTVSEASGQRMGAGLEFDSTLGDIDNGFGAYAFYEFDLPDPISVMLEISYVGGDFDVEAGSGSYTIVGVGGAFLFEHAFGDVIGYIGGGGDANFNDTADVNYDNERISMSWIGGARVAVGEGVRLDFSLRYRALRIDSIEEIEPNPLNADALVLRAGLVVEL